MLYGKAELRPTPMVLLANNWWTKDVPEGAITFWAAVRQFLREAW